MLHLHLIINQQAASGAAKQKSKEIITLLNQKNIEYSTYYTEFSGHAITLTHMLANNHLKKWSEDSQRPFPLLTVLGGDGTLHEVVNALQAFTDIPVAYLPCGSGNDFARGVGLSRQPEEALEHLLSIQAPRFKQVLACTDHQTNGRALIANNLGIGLDAAIVAKANQSKSKKWLNKLKLGSFIYLSSAFHVLLKQEGFPVTFTMDETTYHYENTYLMTSTNHPFFGGGIRIAPEASVDSEDIELVLLEKLPLHKIIKLAGQLLNATHLQSPHVKHFKGKKLRIQSPTRQYGQMDGEVLTPQPIDVTLHSVQQLFWL